ncbi:MAG TPA: alpha/beta fold hydrolase [Candidatus Saccharimonadales bacterium]|nr:alpha/beta fold hydrolase [Candidatus Saccharimonadales bacterium]
MKNAILLHGKPGKEEYYNPEIPSGSNHHWFPWLQKQLLTKDVVAQTPEVPNAWKPYYPTWQKEFERFEITPETMLVGHSCGGGFIVRWLSEHPETRVDKVVLVAPSLGIDWVEKDFFEFTIDPNLASRTKGLVIFGSDNDKPAIADAIKIFRSSIKDVVS